MRKYGEIAKAFGFGEMELKVCRSGLWILYRHLG